MSEMKIKGPNWELEMSEFCLKQLGINNGKDLKNFIDTLGITKEEPKMGGFGAGAKDKEDVKKEA